MLKSVKYVLDENLNNLYRIYSIAKYELLSDMRESNLGLFWNFAHPLIQIVTYWFVFGLVFNRKDVDGIPFIQWMLGGMVVWFFINPCITKGCNAIYTKRNVVTKMKFPVSILPATVVLQELFNHLCILIIVVLFMMVQGRMPSIYWLELLYYMPCAFIFATSLSMLTSVLNMLARDVRKMILACMRMLLYLTPILWPIDRLKDYKLITFIVKVNPIYYIVCGYRDAFFYHRGLWPYHKQMLAFWVITLVIFVIGSCMMFKFKRKIIDLI
ncbi:MAG: ABC transporter permease [Anaerostipes sp.]|nr:ABC transporter permease [Anaerostipes sp.]